MREMMESQELNNAARGIKSQKEEMAMNEDTWKMVQRTWGYFEIEPHRG